MSTSSSRKRGRSLHFQSASSADGLVERFAAWQRRHAWRHLDAVERVWAISDLHMEHEANFDFVSGLAGYERDALVVAGDVCTSLALLRSALKLLAERFRHVFYVVGNHELWHDAHSDGADSFEKLLACYEAATVAGAHAAPALLGSSSGGVAIVPLQSWYHFGFLGGGPAADMPAGHALRMMDSGCVWPGALGGSSTAAGLARFFARCNEESLSQALSAEGRAWLLGRAGQEEDTGREEEDAGQEENAGQEEGASGGKRQKTLPAVERAVAGARRRSRAGRRSVGQSAGAQGGPPDRAGDRRAVVSFSHFLPRAELHRTHPSRLGDRLGDVEGSALLGEQVARLAPDVHVFGHTHFSIDVTLGGTRFLQHPLGNPTEREAERGGGEFPLCNHTTARAPLALVWCRAEGVVPGEPSDPSEFSSWLVRLGADWRPRPRGTGARRVPGTQSERKNIPTPP